MRYDLFSSHPSQQLNFPSRRKVRCNEHKPRCSHCERLNLECLWRPTQQSSRQASSSLRCGNGGDSYTSNRSGSSAPLSASALPNMTSSGYSANDNSFNDIFNYASFMWDPTVEDNLMQASGWRGQGFSDLDGQHIERNSIVGLDYPQPLCFHTKTTQLSLILVDNAPGPIKQCILCVVFIKPPASPPRLEYLPYRSYALIPNSRTRSQL